MHFPEIKEAFYAKCAMLIEGETEYGCIRAFSDKIGVDLDDYGICVINARGEGSIKPLRQLLKLFAVPSIAIYDGDGVPSPAFRKKLTLPNSHVKIRKRYCLL
jgi:putative ATP-dependent endonuclease of OLD family